MGDRGKRKKRLRRKGIEEENDEKKAKEQLHAGWGSVRVCVNLAKKDSILTFGKT